jgi:hypothetical protein
VIRLAPRHVALYVALFAGGFAGTFAARSVPGPGERQAERRPLVRWLGLDEDTARVVHELDPDFGIELHALRQAHDDERAKLAELFENPEVTDAELRTRIEAVIAAGNAVDRRVAEHLLLVRDHLTPGQQRKLFDLCADHVRQHRRRGWRNDAPHGPEDQRGGPRYRGGRG